MVSDPADKVQFLLKTAAETLRAFMDRDFEDWPPDESELAVTSDGSTLHLRELWREMEEAALEMERGAMRQAVLMRATAGADGERKERLEKAQIDEDARQERAA